MIESFGMQRLDQRSDHTLILATGEADERFGSRDGIGIVQPGAQCLTDARRVEIDLRAQAEGCPITHVFIWIVG